MGHSTWHCQWEYRMKLLPVFVFVTVNIVLIEAQGCTDSVGIYRDNGETWQCECNNCTCLEGNIASTLLACPQGCTDSDGKYRDDGETWGCDCNTCTCLGGNVASTLLECTPDVTFPLDLQ